MRRYLQGTLDFACGIYAVINALSITHSLDLAASRHIFSETLLSLAEDPVLWKSFVRNETDHHWLMQYMLQRWCMTRPWGLSVRQPFGNHLLPEGEDASLADIDFFLPEKDEPHGSDSLEVCREEAMAVWGVVVKWLSDRPHRAVLFRFHRFLPRVLHPVVSHWTTGCRVDASTLHLHDASGEKNALFAFERSMLIPATQSRPLVRIVPESLVLVEKNAHAPREPYVGL